MDVNKIDLFRWTNEGVEKGADFVYVVKNKIKDSFSPYFVFLNQAADLTVEQFSNDEKELIRKINTGVIREYLL